MTTPAAPENEGLETLENGNGSLARLKYWILRESTALDYETRGGLISTASD